MDRSVNLEILHGLKPTKSNGDILKTQLKNIFETISTYYISNFGYPEFVLPN